MNPQLDHLVTTKEAAVLVGVSADVVRHWAHRYPTELPVRDRYGPHRWPQYRAQDVVDVERATRHGHAS